MRREEAQRLLIPHVDDLRRMGVTSLALFGSVVRDEARPDSDVDVLVEVQPGMGLFGLFDIQERLEKVLGTKVDLAIRDAVIEELKEDIYGEAVDVF